MKTKHQKTMHLVKHVFTMAAMALLAGCTASRTTSFRTHYLGVDINEKGYIVPGLGDAGDRIFGTL